MLFSQSEQKVKSGICTIEYKSCTKGLRKKSLCVFHICESYTRKYPMAQAVFCENYTRKTPLYIYYIIGTGADAACFFLAFCYDVIVPMRCERQRKGGQTENRMNRTRSETREAGSIADGAQRGNTGRKIHCKGDEQTEIRLQVLYCGRGYYGGLPAIRAYKVKRTPPAQSGGTFQKVYDYQ